MGARAHRVSLLVMERRVTLREVETLGAFWAGKWQVLQLFGEYPIVTRAETGSPAGSYGRNGVSLKVALVKAAAVGMKSRSVLSGFVVVF